jgi:WD40 repeat protein
MVFRNTFADNIGGMSDGRFPHEKAVDLGLITPDYGMIITSAAGVLHGWEVGTGKILWTTKIAKFEPTALACSPDGELLAASGDDATVRLFDTKTGNETAKLTHDRPALTVAFSPDGTRIASGSADKTAKVWQLGK